MVGRRRMGTHRTPGARLAVWSAAIARRLECVLARYTRGVACAGFIALSIRASRAWWIPSVRDIACSLAPPRPQRRSGARAKANEKNPARAAGVDPPVLGGSAGSTIIIVGVRTKRKSGVKRKEKKREKRKEKKRKKRNENKRKEKKRKEKKRKTEKKRKVLCMADLPCMHSQHARSDNYPGLLASSCPARGADRYLDFVLSAFGSPPLLCMPGSRDIRSRSSAATCILAVLRSVDRWILEAAQPSAEHMRRPECERARAAADNRLRGVRSVEDAKSRALWACGAARLPSPPP